MVYVGQNSNGNYNILRCYNSQASGAAVNTAPCGITFTHQALGESLLDFGFQVSDRFISTTVATTSGFTGLVLCQTSICSNITNANQLSIITFYVSSTANTDTPFFLFVY